MGTLLDLGEIRTMQDRRHRDRLSGNPWLLAE
jgi:hypothetical protein